jgi:uncharacterized membrane protein YhaH (DUF805 family)
MEAIAMTFKNAIQTCFSKYAIFSGRASLSEFWWFFLFQILVAFALSIIFPSPIPDLVMCLLFCPGLAVGTRRLHDIGMTGWWQLLLLTGLGFFLLVFFWAQDTKEEDAYTYNE